MAWVSLTISDRYPTGISVLRQFDELAGDQPGRIVDDAAIELEDFTGAPRIAQSVASDRAQGVVTAHLVDRPADGDARSGRPADLYAVVISVLDRLVGTGLASWETDITDRQVENRISPIEVACR